MAACRYPPVGMRSSGPMRAVHYGGPDYLAKANDEIIVMGMVETKEGLANLDAICATPGLDAVYIGPSDLAFALGMNPRPDNPDPVHMATCDKIRDTAHKHGIKACMHCASGTFAAGAVKRGYDLVMVTSDLASMMAGRAPAPRRSEGGDRHSDSGYNHHPKKGETFTYAIRGTGVSSKGPSPSSRGRRARRGSWREAPTSWSRCAPTSSTPS